MQTSRFQLGLIATLAVGLGFSMASSDAVGYPSGAVSLGSNPTWSVGGVATSGTASIIVAPADQELVVTDVVLTHGCMPCTRHTQLEVDAVTVASFRYYQVKDYYDDALQSPHPIQHSFRSGIRVPAGQSLDIVVNDNVDYTISGYYARP